MIYDNELQGAELLGRASAKSKKRMKKIARGLSTFAPGGLLRAAARRISKSKKAKGLVRGFARGAAVGAVTGIPGAGTIGIMIAAAKRRKKQRADAAKKRSVFGGVAPASIPAPAVAPIPGISSVPAPVYAEPDYDQDESEQDDQDESEQDDQDESEQDE